MVTLMLAFLIPISDDNANAGMLIAFSVSSNKLLVPHCGCPGVTD